MRKKWLSVIGAVMLAAVLTTAAFAANPVKLIVNGREIKPDVAPQIINGRTMVPVSWVAEALSADVQWDEKQRIVKIKLRRTSAVGPGEMAVPPTVWRRTNHGLFRS